MPADSVSLSSPPPDATPGPLQYQERVGEQGREGREEESLDRRCNRSVIVQPGEREGGVRNRKQKSYTARRSVIVLPREREGGVRNRKQKRPSGTIRSLFSNRFLVTCRNKR
jgi:hypothetical protein